MHTLLLMEIILQQCLSHLYVHLLVFLSFFLSFFFLTVTHNYNNREGFAEHTYGQTSLHKFFLW